MVTSTKTTENKISQATNEMEVKSSQNTFDAEYRFRRNEISKESSSDFFMPRSSTHLNNLDVQQNFDSALPVSAGRGRGRFISCGRGKLVQETLSSSTSSFGLGIPGRQFTTNSADRQCIAANSIGKPERFAQLEFELLRLHPTSDEEDEDESAQQA